MGIVREGQPDDAKGFRRRPTCAFRESQGLGPPGQRPDPPPVKVPCISCGLWPAMTLQCGSATFYLSVLSALFDQEASIAIALRHKGKLRKRR